MEAAKVIADTNIFVEYVRKRNKQNTSLYKIASSHTLVTTSITVFELYFGARTPDAVQTISQVLKDMAVFSFTDEAAKIAAIEQNRLRSRNKIVDIRDLFVASIAIANDLPVATLNRKHFRNVGALHLLDVNV